MMRENKFAIWDLDNCLSNDSARIKLIEWDKTGNKRYEKYHSDAMLDMPNPFAVRIFKEQEEKGIIPIIFTGRPVVHEDETQLWINQYLRPNNKVMMIMRGNDDARESTPLKMAMLHLCVRVHVFTINQIVAAFDDREPIIEMYKKQGILGAQVLKAHDDCAYTNPHTGESVKE